MGARVSGEADGGASGSGRRHAPTIYDIARIAGVSPSTVSRALSKPGRINIKTETRVREAAASLGYRTNPMARALPTGLTGMIGLVISDITNPVFSRLIRGVEQVSSRSDHTTVLAESQESPEQEIEAAERLQRMVDGVLLVSSRIPDEKIRELASAKPLVVVNREVEGVPCVVPDVGPGIRQALDHLAELGHTSLAYVSGPVASWMNQARWLTLLDEAPRRGLTIVEIGPGLPSMKGGAQLLRRVRASGVTGVVAYNDLMATGLMRAVQDDGAAVPDTLSIVGFDDIFGAELTTPALTSIRSPLGRTGEAAARLLLAEVAGAERPAPADLPTKLVLRQSTGAPRTQSW